MNPAHSQGAPRPAGPSPIPAAPAMQAARPSTNAPVTKVPAIGAPGSSSAASPATRQAATAVAAAADPVNGASDRPVQFHLRSAQTDPREPGVPTELEMSTLGSGDNKNASTGPAVAGAARPDTAAEPADGTPPGAPTVMHTSPAGGAPYKAIPTQALRSAITDNWALLLDSAMQKDGNDIAPTASAAQDLAVDQLTRYARKHGQGSDIYRKAYNDLYGILTKRGFATGEWWARVPVPQEQVALTVHEPIAARDSSSAAVPGPVVAPAAQTTMASVSQAREPRRPAARWTNCCLISTVITVGAMIGTAYSASTAEDQDLDTDLHGARRQAAAACAIASVISLIVCMVSACDKPAGDKGSATRR